MKTQHIYFTSLVFLLGLFLAACGGAIKLEPTPKQAIQVEKQIVLKVSGSGSTVAILDAVQPKFEADTPGYKLEVLSGSGTGGGVKGIIQGVLDVAAMARPPKKEEAAQNVAYIEIGQAGIAIITHPQAKVANLTTAQLLAVFSGEITSWSEVGGSNYPIILYVRDEDDSNTKMLRQSFIDDMPFPETVARVLTSENDMLAAVAGTPGSIGIATWPTAMAREAKVQAISIDGIAPNDSAYPMIGPLGIGYLQKQQTQVQPLLDWLLSESGQTALREFDMIIK